MQNLHCSCRCCHAVRALRARFPTRSDHAATTCSMTQSMNGERLPADGCLKAYACEKLLLIESCCALQLLCECIVCFESIARTALASNFLVHLESRCQRSVRLVRFRFSNPWLQEESKIPIYLWPDDFNTRRSSNC